MIIKSLPQHIEAMVIANPAVFPMKSRPGNIISFRINMPLPDITDFDGNLRTNRNRTFKVKVFEREKRHARRSRNSSPDKRLPDSSRGIRRSPFWTRRIASGSVNSRFGSSVDVHLIRTHLLSSSQSEPARCHPSGLAS